MNIVYFGTDVFLSCFSWLCRAHRVLALYTYHNDEDYFTEYAIVHMARALGIPVHYESITAADMARYVEGDGCELFFIAEYNRILPVPDGLPGFRGINTHSSLLPQGRSYYPIESAMLRGLGKTGVTMHKLTGQLDGGDILAQRAVEVTADMDSIDVYLQCAAQARGMLEEILEDLPGAWARAVPQGQRQPYWRRPEEGSLTLTHRHTRRQAAELFRRFNRMTQVELGGRWYYVSALMDGPTPLPQGEQMVGEHCWLYGAADGHLRLTVSPMPERGKGI